MKSPADKLQITNLARQTHPGNGKFFMEAYEEATGRNWGYLVVDLHPTTNENERLLIDIFDDGYCTVYVKK
jgi:glycosyltransferase involved in cell wall biosynthesis